MPNFPAGFGCAAAGLNDTNNPGICPVSQGCIYNRNGRSESERICGSQYIPPSFWGSECEQPHSIEVPPCVDFFLLQTPLFPSPHNLPSSPQSVNDFMAEEMGFTPPRIIINTRAHTVVKLMGLVSVGFRGGIMQIRGANGITVCVFTERGPLVGLCLMDPFNTLTCG